MLNSTHFVVLAGEPGDWDGETLRRCRTAGEGLAEVQRDQWGRGRRSAVLYRGAIGWYVRIDAPEEWGVLFGPNPSRESALYHGRAWAEVDPKRREFYARRTDVYNLLQSSA